MIGSRDIMSQHIAVVGLALMLSRHCIGSPRYNPALNICFISP